MAKKCPWEAGEIALIVAWTDYCLHYGLDYRNTVVQKLGDRQRMDKSFRTTGLTIENIRLRLRIVTGSQQSATELIEGGTKLLHWPGINASWSDEVHKLRKEWGLEPPQFDQSIAAPPFTQTEDGKTSAKKFTIKLSTNGRSAQSQAKARDLAPASSQKTLTDQDAMDLDYQDESDTPASSSQSVKSAHTSTRKRLSPRVSDTGVRKKPMPNKIQVDDSIRFNKIPDSPRQRGERAVDPTTPYDLCSPTISPLTTAKPATLPWPGDGPIAPPDFTRGGKMTTATQSSSSISAKVDLLSDTVFFILGKTLASGDGDTDVVRDMMKRVRHVFLQKPEAAMGTLTEDLVATTEALRKSEALNRDLIGTRNFCERAAFPRLPPSAELDRDWKLCHQNIGDAVGHEANPVNLSLSSAEHLATHIDVLLSGRVLGSDFRAFMLALDTKSPHAVQLFMSAILCRQAFLKTPDVLSDGQHPLQTLRLYEQIKQTEGITSVKHLDQIATQLLFTDQTFQERIALRSQKLHENFSTKLMMARPSGPGLSVVNEPEVWFKRVVRLKQALLLSPKEYRVYFVRPGTIFNLLWMVAEDVEGFAVSDALCRSKRVKLCLFPALAEQPTDALPANANIRDAMVANKRFLPSREESEQFNPVNTISKATVVLI